MDAELAAVEGESSDALARFRRLFGSPGSMAVRVYSCPGPCVGSFAVPGGFAVSDSGPGGLEAAVWRGVHSTLRAAGLEQAHCNAHDSGRESWHIRSWLASVLLLPLTIPGLMGMFVLGQCLTHGDTQLACSREERVRRIKYDQKRSDWRWKRTNEGM